MRVTVVRPGDLGPSEAKSRVTNASYPVAGGAVWVIPGERAARGLYWRWRR